ncbi:hypothetical protein [Aeromicrobium sp. A1-2]|uniref:hypothetical protein n=1 Tax=Aeromicrobium sp. A1-2 TaxID=2107713 RepID=UPI0013C3291F|nr:hypothetical protein [Aeromicrobium sp. A1-2]
MSNSSALQAWIVEALSAVGGSGKFLDVSKQVWSRHRAELESTGDLVYVWQLELRETASMMAAAAELLVDGDVWALPTGAIARVKPGRWTEDDVRVAVEAYASMLRDTLDGRPTRRREAAAVVVSSTGRTSSMVEAMFANISAVVQELGLDHLPAYPPRSNVPAGVRPAVRESLADLIHA